LNFFPPSHMASDDAHLKIWTQHTGFILCEVQCMCIEQCCVKNVKCQIFVPFRIFASTLNIAEQHISPIYGTRFFAVVHNTIWLQVFCFVLFCNHAFQYSQFHLNEKWKAFLLPACHTTSWP
jgi:hypothetical protein